MVLETIPKYLELKRKEIELQNALYEASLGQKATKRDRFTEFGDNPAAIDIDSDSDGNNCHNNNLNHLHKVKKQKENNNNDNNIIDIDVNEIVSIGPATTTVPIIEEPVIELD